MTQKLNAFGAEINKLQTSLVKAYITVGKEKKMEAFQSQVTQVMDGISNVLSLVAGVGDQASDINVGQQIKIQALANATNRKRSHYDMEDNSDAPVRHASVIERRDQEQARLRNKMHNTGWFKF